ncbi:MAG: AarF/UbiB family protein [bacterium]|nr:AarF/UbiB family protein [bacterium]
MARFFRTIRRYIIVFEVVIDYGFEFLREKFFGGTPAFISPQELRQVLEELGGSFLKFGQLASVRPDFFPEAYCQEFLGLLDEVPPIDPALLDEIFLKEYGKRPEEIFKKFERAPLASASFGQVHEAWLPEGERVAVKIQRPFAAEDFASDARFFSFLGWAMRRSGVVKTVDPVRVVREFIRWTERELDYLKEAEHLERLREQVLKNKLPIKIPKPFPEYTTRRVLVMEFLEGRTLKSFYLEHAPPPNPNKFFNDVIFFELYSYFFDGFFHADPHPANILVLPSGGVGFIDAGIALEIKVSDRKTMARFVEAASRNDLDATVKTFLELVRAPLLEILNEAKLNYPQHWMRIQFTKNVFLRKLKGGLEDLLARWHKASREGGPMHDKSGMHKFMELFDLAERSGIKMPIASVFFARTFLSLDVILLELLPNFNIPQAINEFFKTYEGKFKVLEGQEEEAPFYMAPGIHAEWQEILRDFDEEVKALDRELIRERMQGIMETFE